MATWWYNKMAIRIGPITPLGIVKIVRFKCYYRQKLDARVIAKDMTDRMMITPYV
jgi:hypothetical protein